MSLSSRRSTTASPAPAKAAEAAKPSLNLDAAKKKNLQSDLDDVEDELRELRIKVENLEKKRDDIKAEIARS